MLPACRTDGEGFTIPTFDIVPSDVEGFIDELWEFQSAFHDCFTRSEPRAHFFDYMVGQLSQLERKSIEPMALHVEGGTIRGLQRFISDVRWDEEQMRWNYHQLVAEEMGDPDGVLMFDETGFVKKGKDSVGVARQYCGTLGKVENCQVGVFAGYASRQGYALVDKRLFLPEVWFTEAYAARRARCQVPAELTFRSKPQLAAAMLQAITQEGLLPFKYMVADCLYGNSPAFLDAVATARGGAAMTRPQVEVADVVRQYGAAYLARYGAVTSTAQRLVLHAVAQCRTAVPGGHKAQCDHCGHAESSYNSCRNRHCPKCQSRAQAAWLAARERELLDVPYCHVVFTLPAALSPLALQNPRVMYALLFQTVAATLQTIARDPKHLGAEIGFLGVLHTWGQTLHHHPHLHCLVPAGGLAVDGTAWVPCPPRFFLPVRVLSRLFRRTFLTALRQAAAHEHLSMQGQCQRWHAPPAWHQFLTTMQQTEWVVYAKPPLAGPQRVLRYLARYTHRVAITNRRLLACEDGQVTFRWKDYHRGNRQRTMTLDAVEFIRRFLLHVLPRGFQRMRHYGFLANGRRKVMLLRCRELLGQAPVAPPTTSPAVDAVATASMPPLRAEVCPVCRIGQMQVQETWFAQRTARDVARPVLVCDTS